VVEPFAGLASIKVLPVAVNVTAPDPNRTWVAVEKFCSRSPTDPQLSPRTMTSVEVMHHGEVRSIRFDLEKYAIEIGCTQGGYAVEIRHCPAPAR
jgi:hypothetical protein